MKRLPDITKQASVTPNRISRNEAIKTYIQNTPSLLRTISYQLPNQTNEEKEFFQTLSTIILELPNAQKEDTKVSIHPIQPKDAYPITLFKSSDISFPEILFDTSEKIDLLVGNLCLRNTNTKHEIRIIDHAEKLHKIIQQDAIGDYVRVTKNGQSFSLLSLKEIARRLKHHIVRIDHTGVNIPDALITQDVWKSFFTKIGRVSNLYSYPTGEPWLFILPATDEEYEKEIHDFVIGREPKFELVYDNYSSIPTIQIDIETDITRRDMEKLFPEPYGISFPDLADYFRTVYIDHPWYDLAVRFDLRFKSDHPGSSDWDIGKWLVNDGKRLARNNDKRK